MPELLDWITQALARYGVPPSAGRLAAQTVFVFGVVIASLIANLLARRWLLHWIRAFVGKTKTTWDDALVARGVFDRLARIAPAAVLYSLLPLAVPEQADLQAAIHRIVVAYMILIGSLAADALLSAVLDVYETLGISRARPIKTYVQVAKLALYLVAAILILAMLLDRSPWGFLTGLGALTAVIMLVFKDTILGFVGSIQLIANDMVRLGDWIEVPKYGADGDVVDLTINTVKVRNWDKTITTIPTYNLISDSFKNWRGMSESGGRRIKRDISIDISSVKFCTPAMLDRFESIGLISDYVRSKRKEVEDHNRQQGVNPAQIADGRRLTNLGTFRAYVIAYLRRNPNVHPSMTFLVRQLQPGSTGLPLEVYVFSADQVWSSYEAIQADIFDHLIAVIPHFELRVFQNPSGADIERVLGRVSR